MIETRLKAFGIILVLAAGVGAALGLNSDPVNPTTTNTADEKRPEPVSSPAAVSSAAHSTVEYKLAAIDSKNSEPPGDLVLQFDVVLRRLEERCQQDRWSKPSLGDMAVAGARILEKTGQPVSLLNLLRAVELSVNATSAVNVDCAKVIASFVTGVQEGSR